MAESFRDNMRKAMTKEKKVTPWKELMVKELAKRFKENTSFFVSSYTGLTAEDLNELRRQLEASSSRYIVVKNSIAKLALNRTGLEALTGFVNADTGFVFSAADPAVTAKVVSKFSKSHEPIKLRGGYLDGNIVDAERIKYFASLPGRGQLLTSIVYGIKYPITGFVGVLENLLRGFLYAIQAVKDKKEK